MICSYCEFLADIAPFSKIHYERGQPKYKEIFGVKLLHPPIASRLDSIGNACIGGISTIPSGTP